MLVLSTKTHHTGKQKWSIIVQYSHTSTRILDLGKCFSESNYVGPTCTEWVQKKVSSLIWRRIYNTLNSLKSSQCKRLLWSLNFVKVFFFFPFLFYKDSTKWHPVHRKCNTLHISKLCDLFLLQNSKTQKSEKFWTITLTTLADFANKSDKVV